MLELEKELGTTMTLESTFVTHETLSMALDKYSTPTIVDHLEVLRNSGLIKAFPQSGDGKIQEYIITDIYPKGYDFLSKVRSDNAFNKIKCFTIDHIFDILGLLPNP